MNLQQLEYISAVNKLRHFGEAAKHCGVTQPTLSQMIQKLEQELNVTIFNRAKQPVEPTATGEKLIRQAEKTLREMRRMEEIVDYETEKLDGPLKIGVIPTLANYLVPDLISVFRKEYPLVEMGVTEMHTANLIKALERDELDMFIAATPLEQPDFFEIPVYYERFVAYFHPDHPLIDKPLSADDMPKKSLWVLQEGHCMRSQLFNFCTKKNYNRTFEAGSIDTLIRIVDKNGGYSVIPELHTHFLSEEQKKNIRPIDNPPAVREVSIVIKADFIRERLINAVADSVKAVIPEHMLDERMKKFSIKL
ncbi:transcriptional regulator (plasmid) [Fulvitalea axinellae]|uniref:Transcriptional regulator n=1 Tax=Fulvitalea axinellae TaxID=1182444 RepID=A0AAU9DG68_9BACT|nr:transcriptional regulator [Fulvitalea axinellae]